MVTTSKVFTKAHRLYGNSAMTGVDIHVRTNDTDNRWRARRYTCLLSAPTSEPL